MVLPLNARKYFLVLVKYFLAGVKSFFGVGQKIFLARVNIF